MIRVVRPTAPPAVLAGEGVAKAQAHCEAHANGSRDFQFDSTIYGHATVKQSLVDMHHGKCCYCESKVRHTGPGTIDHYRPKAASQPAVGAPLTRPGYYWLAYDWQNLLFACVACNQTHKRNLFPLADDRQRALSHLQSIANEAPLLLDPANPNDDPANGISFREEYAFAINGNPRGQATIDVLALNDRPDLVERRRERIKILQIMRNILELMPESLEAQQFLHDAVLDTAEYAAMVRVFLQ